MTWNLLSFEKIYLILRPRRMALRQNRALVFHEQIMAEDASSGRLPLQPTSSGTGTGNWDSTACPTLYTPLDGSGLFPAMIEHLENLILANAFCGNKVGIP